MSKGEHWDIGKNPDFQDFNNLAETPFLSVTTTATASRYKVYLSKSKLAQSFFFVPENVSVSVVKVS